MLNIKSPCRVPPSFFTVETIVAVVFDEIPNTWEGMDVISGDDHDLRFTDPHGKIVGLEAKGKAKQDNSGFVVKVKNK